MFIDEFHVMVFEEMSKAAFSLTAHGGGPESVALIHGYHQNVEYLLDSVRPAPCSSNSGSLILSQIRPDKSWRSC